jgi:hypothetical protein
MGWSGTQNGPLLRLAAQHFDIFLTADQSLEYQPNLKDLRIAVLVLVDVTNRIEALRPLVQNLLKILPSARQGQILHVGG